MKGKTNITLLVLIGVFLFVYFVPFSATRVSVAIGEAFLLLSEYAREHVLLCLVPALFIAGAISVFLNQQSVIRYLGYIPSGLLLGLGYVWMLWDDQNRCWHDKMAGTYVIRV